MSMFLFIGGTSDSTTFLETPKRITVTNIKVALQEDPPIQVRVQNSHPVILNDNLHVEINP